jgi:hypothetical protein
MLVRPLGSEQGDLKQIAATRLRRLFEADWLRLLWGQLSFLHIRQGKMLAIRFECKRNEQ